MRGKAVNPKLPRGAKVLRRENPRPSFELAEQLARRGASESLVRAIGGDVAVEQLLDVEPSPTDSEPEQAAGQA